MIGSLENLMSHDLHEHCSYEIAALLTTRKVRVLH